MKLSVFPQYRMTEKQEDRKKKKTGNMDLRETTTLERRVWKTGITDR